jgi:hypothetical protein
MILMQQSLNTQVIIDSRQIQPIHVSNKRKHNKMKKTLLTLSILALAVSTYGFEREYVKRAVLTKEQEKTVIELAKKAGIKKVAKISSHNMYPTPFRGLRVQGVEQVKGREVSYQVLSMSHGGWLQPGAKPRKGQVQMGNFWAGKPYTKKQIILKVGKKEYRTGSITGMKPEECEKILSQLMSEDYDLGPSVNEKRLKQVDWTKPSRFSKRGENISAGFLHKGGPGSGFFDLQIKQDGIVLTITQMFQAVP